ncbi:timeless family protein [Striga hermonthica]|uniref:Timeless family protein n=1 Tax=Striga hermonthica TaxID=68872 RepID=A0A9N7N1F1_STRHE|nr:timeless family protein [Striga hermonthica]
MDGLSSICAGLGLWIEDENGKPMRYSKSEYCSDNLKDLLRFLRRDDPEKRDVFKQICKWKIVGENLIPIIEYYQEDRSLVLNSVKVLVFLTMPIEPASLDISQQIEYLWGLKSAITFSDIIPVIVSLLESPLENLENECFTEDDWKLVQLVITFFRNVLAIQDVSSHQITGGLATQFLSLRDRFLELLFKENVMDLILVLSQHSGSSHDYLHQDNLLFLEIFYHIFKGQQPELIAKAYLKGSKVGKASEDAVTSLQSIMKEEQEKRKRLKFHSLSCYSQLSGTFTRFSLDGSKALLKGNPSAVGNVSLKAHKNARGSSKKKVGDSIELPSTKPEILHLLADFISQFLMGGYNVLMRSILDDIVKEHQEILSSDVVIFFQVAQFVTSFQYHKCVGSKPSIEVENEASATRHDETTIFNGSICGPIAETLNEPMFLLVISKWRFAFESLRQTNDYKFLSVAGSLVKTMIRMLDLVLKQSPEDSKEPQTARVLLYKLFYDQTEEGMTQFLLNLIKSFDAQKQSKSDLANLVESMHVILRLVENLQSRGSLRVSKKSRKKRTKKTTEKNENACEPSAVNVASQTEIGNATCEAPVDANMSGFDTLLNQDTNIEAELSTRDFTQVDQPVLKPTTCEAPIDANMSGFDMLLNQDTNIEAEFSTRDFTRVDQPVLKPTNSESNESEVNGGIVADNDVLLETDDSSGDDQLTLTNEVDLNASSLVSALANNSIIENLCWLLKFYKTNSITTNHYIISMLRRICDDLELSPMLYQLSLLTIFYDILEEQQLRPSKVHENIVTFLTTLVRRMLRKMKDCPLLFVEVLFWKTRKECHYINCGAMIKELKGIRKNNGEGRSENEGDSLFEGQKWARRSIADALGDDDFGTSVHDSQHEGHPEEGSNGSLETGNDITLTDEMRDKIKDLYQKYKDNRDCCQLIAGELDPNGEISSTQVSKILKPLGFKVPAEAKMKSSKENSSMRKPTHSRKRVQAFSEDQEQKIKELFEQFKDNRRCSYMIANALEGNGGFSAAQISRKLKQLGLMRPKNNKSQSKMSLRDEPLSDHLSEGASEYEDETLLSMKNRSKQKRNGSQYDERHSKKAAKELPEDMSDDELLSSMLVKTKKRPRKSEELMTDSSERGNFAQSDEMTDTIQLDNGVSYHYSDSEMDTTGLDNLRDSNKNSSEKGKNSEDPFLDDGIEDELADFDENTVHITTQDNPSLVPRRRLRMVLDFEDGDD